MATQNATTAQGGYLDNNRSTAIFTWEDVVKLTASGTAASVNGSLVYTRAGFTSGRSPVWLSSRAYLVFDTSVITGTLTDFQLNIYVDGINSANYNPEAWVERVGSPTLSTALTTSDYDQSDTSAYDYSIFPGGTGWQALTLNSTTWAYAEANSEMTLRLRDTVYDRDYSTNLTDPPGDGSITYRYNYASYIPYLYYTMATGYGKTVNGIIAANMSKVDGVAKASISKVLGV